MITFLILVVSYFIGSIPFGVFYSRKITDLNGQISDIRKKGSKSIGATNIKRHYGEIGFYSIIAADASKGLIAVLLASYFLKDVYVWLAGLMAVLGHLKSVILYFLDRLIWNEPELSKGGKGIATSGGVLLGLSLTQVISPVLLPLLLATWLIVLKISDYMSMASLLTAVFLPVFVAYFERSEASVVITLIVTTLVIWAHRSNIQRLFEGTEPRYSQGKRKEEVKREIPTGAFLIHPTKLSTVLDYIIAKLKSERSKNFVGYIMSIALLGKVVEYIVRAYLKTKKNFFLGEVEITSPRGGKACVRFYVVPRLPEQLSKEKDKSGTRKVTEASLFAAIDGCLILCLGASTAIVGDNGKKAERALRGTIKVTTGNSLTTYAAYGGAKLAIKEVGRHFEDLTVAVVGANGSMGKALCNKAEKDGFRWVYKIVRETPEEEKNRILRLSDVVFCVASERDIIRPDQLKPGAILVDVARPRNIGLEVIKKRPDVLVIAGGMLKIPGHVVFPALLGLEPSIAWGCLSELITLLLDRNFVSYTVGKDITEEMVEYIGYRAEYHGLEVSLLRGLDEKPLSEEEFNRFIGQSVKEPV